ncbi:plasmid partition protein ParG [Candidatus Protochlamydia amoebophila]|uniref:CopG family transcriptional regulator n=1 Tax=Protochlamydia amoebophila (strain UWE25) TaxID=264201 RepID=Q6MCI6_PARUW|nr:plasmid partition protein ParG [Candidatus Protochlamydia amoebophila]CAF23713.1 unnamed protein product [Candidatus Protochlamydia amoebophila UWE25]
MEKQYKKLSVDFPIEEYSYLKMACVKKGVSVKDFVTQAVIMSIEDYEDELDDSSLGKARKEVADNGVISWKELEQRLGWDNL